MQAKETTNTRMVIDLSEELTSEELAQFKAAAAEAGATLTEHFLNITLRVPADPNADADLRRRNPVIAPDRRPAGKEAA